jgi:hypothetical protein
MLEVGYVSSTSWATTFSCLQKTLGIAESINDTDLDDSAANGKIMWLCLHHMSLK